jgi:hypothetical protein
MSNIAVTEGAFSGSGTLSAVTSPLTTLAPGAQTSCTATYTVTELDVDAGTLTNAATAAGTAPGSTGPVSSNQSSVTLPIPAMPGLSITKSANPTSAAAAGQTIT